MKSIVVLCGILLLFGGCKRGSQSNTSTAPTDQTSSTPASAPGEARALLEKGKQLYREDQDQAAVEAFQQAIKLDPDLAEAHFRLGLGYETLNKAEEAEGEYKKAVEGLSLIHI